MNFTTNFRKVGELFKPIIQGKGKEKVVPLLLEENTIKVVQKILEEIPNKDYTFELYCAIVAGACSISMKYKPS